MRVVRTNLNDVLLIEPKLIGDARGFFQEAYRVDQFAAAGIGPIFVQDNHSRSAKGVLRGLHFQEPNGQGKLVRVIRGAIFDVAVDVRRGSPQFGAWTGAELSGENFRQFWVPPGFAHGFLTLVDDTDVVYKCTDYYAPQQEHAIAWDDPAIGIVWPDIGMSPHLSTRDATAPPLRDAGVLPTYAAA